MREFRFRAWDKKNKCFAPSMYWHIDPIGQFIWNKDGTEADIIVQQFTGLKDKNGREIYEGDICNSDKGTKSFVIFTLDGFRMNSYYDGYASLYECVKICGCEIIGNIYENKNLFEK